MKKTNSSTLVTVIAALFVFSYLVTANGPAALEAKRVSDLCNASFGFGTPEAIACVNPGSGEVVAMATIPEPNGF